MASIPWHRAGADPIQLSVSQVGPLDELQEDKSPPHYASSRHRGDAYLKTTPSHCNVAVDIQGVLDIAGGTIDI